MFDDFNRISFERYNSYIHVYIYIHTYVCVHILLEKIYMKNMSGILRNRPEYIRKFQTNSHFHLDIAKSNLSGIIIFLQ